MMLSFKNFLLCCLLGTFILVKATGQNIHINDVADQLIINNPVNDWDTSSTRTPFIVTNDAIALTIGGKEQIYRVSHHNSDTLTYEGRVLYDHTFHPVPHSKQPVIYTDQSRLVWSVTVCVDEWTEVTVYVPKTTYHIKWRVTKNPIQHE